MSVSLTERAVVERRKTVTRRLGWRMLKPGDRLTLCRKVMGRRNGEPLVRLAEVEVVGVRREPLWNITAEDVEREGVHDGPFDDRFDEVDGTGKPTPEGWAQWFCEEMNVRPDTEVTRIEWRYLETTECPAPPTEAGESPPPAASLRQRTPGRTGEPSPPRGRFPARVVVPA
jgi:hypothetical protein